MERGGGPAVILPVLIVDPSEGYLESFAEYLNQNQVLLRMRQRLLRSRE